MPDTTFSDRPTASLRRSGASDGDDPSELTPGANTSDPGVRAAILAAYEIAAHPGPADLRAHDLLRRLRRDASILDEATACVRSDTVAHPDSDVAHEGLLLLERARLIGLFY
jgi:hypothetical protein